MFILGITTFYSNHGTDWGRAFIRTFFVGLFFYSIVFVLQNLHNEIDITGGANEYFAGFFRYLLPTNFYNPLADGDEYLSNAYEWFFFLLGKIAIAIGIYETIVSFRKFRK